MTPDAPPPPARVASIIGAIQILAWGSTYYLLAILAEPIVADTGWSRGAVTGGLSIALIASGLVAPRVAALVVRHGGRPVLAGAALLCATGLGLLAAATSVWTYLGAWLVIGIGMGAGLYDAAYSTLGRLYGIGARRPITMLTLWGGFASTVCWPISAILVESVGWRGTCLAYAAAHLLLALPLALFALPRERRLPVPTRGANRRRPVPLDRRFWLLALAATAIAAMMSSWSVHLVTILQAQGLTLASAVAAAALIGPAQVGARVVEMVLGQHHHPAWTMLVSTALIATGFIGLAAGVPAALALVAYGAGNGVWSIVRGTLPLALFGPEDYPALIGRIALPSLVTGAAAPFAMAYLIEGSGADAGLAVLLAASAVPVACSLAMLAVLRR